MASKKLSAAILVISLLFYSTLSSACNYCNPTPTYSPPIAPTPTCNSCNPTPTYSPPIAPPAGAYCPTDTLKLGVCVDLLGLINLQLGTPPTSNCCALLTGLTNLEAALCLCTAIKANVLGINLNVPVSLSLLLSACQKTVPAGFQCQ